MQDHEFYADPTVFDCWQSRASNWLRRRSSKLYPYRWALAFASVAALFALTAVIVFAAALSNRAGGSMIAWNQSMAQVITILLALLACQAFLQQALQSWPVGVSMPRDLRRLIRLCGWDVPSSAGSLSAHDRTQRRSRQSQTHRRPVTPSREDIQAFFSGVRAAGVNVTIARALFSAGVRTPRQLCQSSDAQLLAIHGVGSATVSKLRQHFNDS